MSDRGTREERRRHYRTRVPSSWALEVRVVGASREPVSAELIDMSAGGAGVRLPRQASPPWRAGELVVLELRAPGAANPLQVRAVTQRCVLMATGYLYGFRFSEHLDLGLGTPETVRQAFNRRQLPRVRPTPVGSARAVVAPLGLPRHAVTMSVHDLSCGGLAFVASQQAHVVLGGHYDFALELSLPAVAERLHLVGHVRYRARVPSGWRYGVEFDRRRSESFSRQQSLIAAYINAFLREQSAR